MTTWYRDYESKKEEALEILVQRPLYNVDFQRYKDTLNRAFESAYDAEVGAPFFHCGRYEDRPEAVNDLTMSDWSLHRLPGLRKKVNACEAVDPALTAMEQLLENWESAYHVLVDAKRDAIKGRKPSTTPRKTPERTLENTGTCPVCGRNVKMNAGRIVDHGFEVRWNQRSGQCFGVGYEPWEVSPKGKYEYLASVYAYIRSREESREAILADAEGADPYEVQKDLAVVESDIRFAKKTAELMEAELSTWEPRPLPGERYAKA